MCLGVLSIQVFTTERKIKPKWKEIVTNPWKIVHALLREIAAGSDPEWSEINDLHQSFQFLGSEDCQSCHLPWNWQVKQTLLENKKHFPTVDWWVISFCAMCGVAMAVQRRTIMVHPQGTGTGGEIWAVSAAPESMTPVCKQWACAGTGLMLQPRDTTLSLLLNNLHSERVRGGGWGRVTEWEGERERERADVEVLVCENKGWSEHVKRKREKQGKDGYVCLLMRGWERETSPHLTSLITSTCVIYIKYN